MEIINNRDFSVIKIEPKLQDLKIRDVKEFVISH